MRYEVTVAGRTFSIDTGSTANGRIVVDGKPVDALIERDSSGGWELRSSGRTVGFTVDKSGGAWHVAIGGRRWTAEVSDSRTRIMARYGGSASAAAGGGSVMSPMPGLVLSVLVEVGERVTPDSGVVMLEAMKMENEIRAGVSGRVSRLGVSSGEAVEKGAVLLEVDPEG